MTPDTEDNGWDQWKIYILEGQKEQNKKLDEILRTQKHIEIELTTIKVKSGILGTIAGVGGGILTIVAKFFLSGSR